MNKEFSDCHFISWSSQNIFLGKRHIRFCKVIYWLSKVSLLLINISARQIYIKAKVSFCHLFVFGVGQNKCSKNKMIFPGCFQFNRILPREKRHT